jgi:hypothetical protein
MKRLLAIILALALHCHAARKFNGTSDYVSIPGSGTAVDVTTGSFTYSFWFYPTNIGNTDIVSKWSGGEQYLSTIGPPDGGNDTPVFAWHETGAPQHPFVNCGGLTLVNNVWYHVISTWSIGPNSAGASVNGISCGGTGIFGSIVSNGLPLFLGQRGNASMWFTGSIAEFALWNVALSAGEISSLDKGVSPPQVRRTNLTAYYPVYGITTGEPDLSGGLNTGTVTGTLLGNHCPCGNPVLR